MWLATPLALQQFHPQGLVVLRQVSPCHAICLSCPCPHLGQPPNPPSQPKTTSSYPVTSPTPTHSHFSRAVPSQPPPFPEPSTGHHYNPPVDVGPSVSRTPGGASVAQAGNYFQQGQPAQARNYFQQGQPAQAGNYFQQGQPATSNFTQMPNSTGGGARECLIPYRDKRTDRCDLISPWSASTAGTCQSSL
ncbi:hypothetical protein BC826DRAFT_1025806 [Russula brevipes]|nr:hypothetical protein BC826DRAFT_1025806 [Russula brevipes]